MKALIKAAATMLVAYMSTAPLTYIAGYTRRLSLSASVSFRRYGGSYVRNRGRAGYAHRQ